jgi:hypothetical protein
MIRRISVVTRPTGLAFGPVDELVDIADQRPQDLGVALLDAVGAFKDFLSDAYKTRELRHLQHLRLRPVRISLRVIHEAVLFR